MWITEKQEKCMWKNSCKSCWNLGEHQTHREVQVENVYKSV